MKVKQENEVEKTGSGAWERGSYTSYGDQGEASYACAI